MIRGFWSRRYGSTDGQRWLLSCYRDWKSSSGPWSNRLNGQTSQIKTKISGVQAKLCTTFLALAWLLCLSAPFNAYDSHWGTHTHDVLPIGADEIIVYVFCIQIFEGKKVWYSFLSWDHIQWFQWLQLTIHHWYVTLQYWRIKSIHLSSGPFENEFVFEGHIVHQLPVTKWPWKDTTEITKCRFTEAGRMLPDYTSECRNLVKNKIIPTHKIKHLSYVEQITAY